MRCLISVGPIIDSSLANDRSHMSISLVIEDWATKRSVDWNLTKIRPPKTGNLSVEVGEGAKVKKGVTKGSKLVQVRANQGYE